jgi:CubicO group peptidase (beta-lactamase class C family)
MNLSVHARLGACLAALLVVASPAAAQDVARMQQVVQASVDQGEFTGSVLVARDGEVLLDQGYGLANREWSIPNAGDTKFRLGSVTKQFTAVGLMLLNERGLVDLEAPVKTYLPDAPAAWDAITVRHLLNHTSGIPNFTNDPDFPKWAILPTTVAELVSRFDAQALRFTPGARYEYSNSGYIMLTAIIEAVSGKSYADYMTESLFQPLGLGDTGYDSHARILPRRASGYTPSADGVVNADYADMTVPQGAGALYSTTRDLLKWEQALFGGRVLRPESLAQLTTPNLGNYALGLMVVEKDGHRIVSHGGGIQGFNTFLGYDATDRMTVVVLGNLNGSAPDRLGDQLLTLARGGSVTLPTDRVAVSLPADSLAAYEGVYALAPTFSITVTVSDGKLMAQATGQPAFELHAAEPDQFFLTVVDARVSFTRDSAGQVQGLILHQNGRDMPGRKTTQD